MSNPQPTIDRYDLVPMSQKIAFGVGMLANQMFPAALSIFMVVLVQGLGMDPWMWGVVAFLPRLFDALTDPAMGFITDNTRSRWGRRRPYVFVGALLAGGAYVLMWQLDAANSDWYNFWYFLGFALVFYLGMTIYGTPYVAMGYEMSSNFHERTRVMAVAQWIGQWAWVIVPWFWVILYDPDIYETAVVGARSLAVWVGIACAVLGLVPAVFCKTQPVDESKLEDLSLKNLGNNISHVAQNFVATFKIGPFVRICAATFFVFNAFNTVAAFSFFIIVHYMFMGDAGAAGTWPTWFGTAGALSTTFLSIPIVTMMSERMGKKNAFVVAQSISIVGYASFWWCFNPEAPWMILLPLPLFSFGIGSLFTVMMSMTADVCDLDELATGARREGAFGAVYWWMVKFGFAIAALFSGLIMQAVGFDADASQQTAEAMKGMRLAYILVPVGGTATAILVMLGYGLDEKRADEVRAELAARKNAANG